MSLIVIILTLWSLLAANAYRDWVITNKLERAQKEIDLRLRKISRQLHYVGDLAKKIEDTDRSVIALRTEAESINDFVTKAQTDLATIVNEYEVNGVPLGLDRSGAAKFDTVEGL